MIVFCPSCNADRDASIRQMEESYPVKGDTITITANVMVCGVCGETIYDDELDSENVQRAYAKYREKHGLLSPEDLRELRAKYGLSQRGLSGLLGWSPATIARYEAGAIPSAAHNAQLVRFRDDSSYALELYEAGKSKLNRLEAKRVAEAFTSLGAENSLARALAHFLTSQYTKSGPQYTGNRDLDLDKLVNMVLFFASSLPDLVKSKLLKLLWYTDYLHFKRQGISMSGTVYVKNHYGPIPAHHETLMTYMLEEGVIEMRPYEGPYEGDCVLPLVDFDRELFSEEELNVLDAVLARFRNSTARDLSDSSHAEDGYQKVDMKQLIPYVYANSLKALN